MTSLKLSIIACCLSIAATSPTVASERADLLKGLAAWDVLATIARVENCHGIDHETILKNLFALALVLNETDDEMDMVLSEEDNLKGNVEAQLHKIGSDKWCKSASFMLKKIGQHNE